MVAGAWGEEASLSEGRLRLWLTQAAEAQHGRAFLWSPIALTFGIWSYFGLGAEPGWLAIAPPGFAALLLLWFGRRSGAVVLIALTLLGAVLAKARSDFVATPLLHATTAELQLTGTVQDVSASGKRRTLILAPGTIEGMTPDEVPRRLRLSAFAQQGDPVIGDRIQVKARLAPLPSPVIPGGFDYGRQLWFQGIGGTGRLTGDIQILSQDRPWASAFDQTLAGIRKTINTRINAVLTGDTAAFAEALIDGERGTIPKALNRSFQISGLAHVLSISGLHMSLAAGGVFWFVRALLAAIPVLALRYPIKKWAAAAALAAGLFYMLLAGAEVATQRSYIMIAVVFFAILVDRPALSIRNLALAALIILVMQPEAAIQASFQMSFLAVLGLAAFFEAWVQWRRGRDDETYQRQSAPVRVAWKFVAIVGASLATTLVAGAMSGIPAAFHFGRIAPYGIIANGLAIPVISIFVMPMALAATVLMPLGLEAWPLWLMGQGLDLTIAISDWVAGLPGAQLVVAQQQVHAAMLAAFGAVLLCLLAGPIRFAGIAVLFIGLGLATIHHPPDILIDRGGANVALLDEQGRLVPANARKDRFAVEKWLVANGEEATAVDAAKRPGWICADHLCKAQVKSKSVTYVSDGVALPLACDGIDILIADFPLRGACKPVATRIDRFDLWRNGAHAVTISGDSVIIRTARQESGVRPWVVVPEPRKTKYQPQLRQP